MDKPNAIPDLPVVLVAHPTDKRGKLELGTNNQCAGTASRTIPHLRRQPRFKFEVDISVRSRSCGVLNGRSVDISESGLAAIMVIEAPVGEVVELEFALPFSSVTIRAVVRQKNAFRHGFEFIDSDSAHEGIRRTCRDLAVQQSTDISLIHAGASPRL